MMRKLKTSWRMILVYANWPRLILYKMKVLPSATVVMVRGGPNFYVRSSLEQEADLYVANESYLYGIHDEMLPYMKNAKVGLDVGAHIGTFSLFAAKHSPAKIYAIEAEADNFELLKKNIALNNLEKRIIPTQVVLASTTGEREFYISQNRGLNSLFEDHGEQYGGFPVVDVKKVKSVSLKDFFDANRIDFCDFMKVDIEGAEYEVFSNLPRDVYDRIGVISLEIGGRSVPEREALENHIRSMGFAVSTPRKEFSERFCVNKKLEERFAV